MWALRTLIISMATHFMSCHMTLSYIQLQNYSLADDCILNLSGGEDEDLQCGSIFLRCKIQCGKMQNCKSFAMRKDFSRCQLYNVSVAAIGSTPVEDPDWDTYIFRDSWNPIVKFSAGNTNYMDLNAENFYNTDDYNASFPDDNCGIDPAEKCNRPYKHTLQKEILARNNTTEVKISVYKDGSEVAWAIFGKNPGAGDVWFDPSRIIDSYPWNKSQLQENTARFLKKGVGNRNFWMISEGVKYNTFNVGTKSAHAHWLTILTGRSCDLRVETAVPAIMYSKVGGPVFLGTRTVGQVQRNPSSHVYDTPGTLADTVCSTYLHTRLATKSEVNYERTNKGYSCCAGGWMTDTSLPSGLRGAYPMTQYSSGCGGPGLLTFTTNTATKQGVFCKVNNDDVGEGDTLVISVKLE